MRNIIGNIVSGADFYGREKTLRKMLKHLKNGASLFIPGPRRIGKSSIVTEFINRYSKEFNCLYFNLQGRFSIAGLCEDIKTEINKTYPGIFENKNYKSIWNTFSKMIPEIGVSAIKIKTGQIEYPNEDYLQLMEELFIKLCEDKFVFILDEFSDFIFNLKKRESSEPELFLEWMRKIRQTQKVQIIITGSINILSTLEEFNFIDLVNDMTDIRIPQLKDYEVKEFLTLLLNEKEITLSKEAEAFAVEKLKDGIPFYIQLFADELFDNFESCVEISLDEIETAYKNITNRNDLKELVYMRSRLKEYLDNNCFNAAKKILAHLSHNEMTAGDLYPYISNTGIDKNNLFRILDRLTDENYISKKEQKYSFVSAIVKDWWKNKYGDEK